MAQRRPVCRFDKRHRLCLSRTLIENNLAARRRQVALRIRPFILSRITLAQEQRELYETIRATRHEQ